MIVKKQIVIKIKILKKKGGIIMLVDKIYYKYRYMGNWFAIIRLKINDKYATRVVRMPEQKIKELKVGDIL